MRALWQTMLAGAALAAVVMAIIMMVMNFGVMGLAAIAGMTLAAVCVTLHPLVPFTLYFGTLFFTETSIPGVPVTANQVLGILFLASWFSWHLRGKTMSIRSGFLWLLGFVALYFALNGAAGENTARGLVHARYVVIYFAMACCLASSLTTERTVMALAWIITLLTLGGGCAGLAEAAEKNTFALLLAGGVNHAARIRGAAPNPVVFAWQMLYGFPFAFYIYAQSRNAAARGFALAAGFFLMLVAILTFNRQTFILIVLLLAVCALLYAYPNRKMFLAMLAAVIAVVAATILPFIIQRMFTVTELGRDISFLERYDSLLLGLEMFRAHPVIGVGLGSFPAVWGNYIPPDYSTYYMQFTERSRLKYPDFGWLALLSETGLAGIVLCAGLFGAIAARAWRARRWATARKDFFVYNLSATLLTLLIFIVITTAIQDTFLYVRVWMVFGLALLMDRHILLPAGSEPADAM
ncbi:MAG: O-antigen ligase family protein [bacterium]|nr:O-antigen ligase family protein [Candidatus Sumerlaeota bacterium]